MIVMPQRWSFNTNFFFILNAHHRCVLNWLPDLVVGWVVVDLVVVDCLVVDWLVVGWVVVDWVVGLKHEN